MSVLLVMFGRGLVRIFDRARLLGECGEGLSAAEGLCGWESRVWGVMGVGKDLKVEVAARPGQWCASDKDCIWQV
jgi:hypothetical protein